MYPDSKRSLLLIDDDPDMLMILKLKLTREGFDVKTSENALNLFDMINAKTPDLILMDLNMPLVSGDIICRLIRHNKKTEDVPVIMFSGNRDIKNISQACGASGFINKPCDPSTLKKEIEKYIQ